MAISAANSYIGHLELCRRDCRQPEVASSSVGIPGGGFSVAKAGAWRKGGRGRVEMKVAAFWQDSRPTSIEMQSIAGLEELDQILSRAQELSEIVIIDWMAAWCRKCIYLKPKLEKLAAEFYPRIKFYFVDVNKVPQALVKRGKISKMPTIQLWKDGECKAEVIGGHQAWLVLDEVREMIQKHK